MNILYNQPLSKTFAEQPVITLPDSIKQSFTGIYKFRQEDSLKVAVHLKDATLIVAIDGQAEFEILPVFKNQFKNGQTRVEFMMNKEGKPEQIMIYRKGEIMGAKKVE